MASAWLSCFPTFRYGESWREGQHVAAAVPSCALPRLLPYLPPTPSTLTRMQSLTADLFPAAQRGRAFGGLYFVGAVGGMIGALYATNLGEGERERPSV